MLACHCSAIADACDPARRQREEAARGTVVHSAVTLHPRETREAARESLGLVFARLRELGRLSVGQ